jgi:hypothetical protein
MTVTVLYPEDRQIPDLALEQEIFGPEVRLIRAAKPSFAELDPTDCAATDRLMTCAGRLSIRRHVAEGRTVPGCPLRPIRECDFCLLKPGYISFECELRHAQHRFLELFIQRAWVHYPSTLG